MAPTSGRIRFDGEDITALSPQARARRGLGRTFQRMELFDGLTVLDNVAMGREAAQAGSNPIRQLFARRSERAEMHDAAVHALDTCGIRSIAGRPVGELSTGQRRLVELARALAGTFSLLLLDEPSSGLDPIETRDFGAVLESVVRERGTGLLLVDHDMALVMRVCDHIYVLDFGELIFEGTPEQTQASEIVRRAYLGEAAA
jgi:ABC-type branched-subunit amino acid transport system ATPase component